MSLFFENRSHNAKHLKELAMEDFIEIDGAIGVLKENEKQVTEEEISVSWQKVLRRICVRRKKRNLFWTASAAAVCCVVALTMLWRQDDNKDEFAIMRFIAESGQPVTENGNITLIVPGQPDVKVATSNVNVVQSSEELVVMDTGNNVQVTLDTKASSKEIEYTQLIVPKGKRTCLTLSDGTRIWVNSGSRVVYPTILSEKREIYLVGEAYLEVARNENCPFVVHTDNCKVEVLGTVFNVSSYAFQESSSIVLVEGKVTVRAEGQESVTLAPGELVNVSDGVISDKECVDVDSYISWVHNILMCDNDPLKVVFDRLEVCYGKKVILGPEISFVPVTGKLYLKDSLTEVLKSISYSVPLVYEDNGDTIFVYKKIEEVDTELRYARE